MTVFDGLTTFSVPQKAMPGIAGHSLMPRSVALLRHMDVTSTSKFMLGKG